MLRKNVAGQFIHFQGVDATTGGIKSGVTWTMRRCLDGTFAAGGGTVTEDGTTGWYKCALSQADTNGNNCGYNFTGTGAVPQTVNAITTAADPTDAVRLGLTALPNANAEAAGGLYTRGSGAGQINQPANGQIDANTVKIGGTTQTARDIGASVLLSAGSGTGQLDFASGVVKANLAQILGTALTETAGQIAAGFKQFFDIASPTSTMNTITAVTTTATATAVTTLNGIAANVITAASIAAAALNGKGDWNIGKTGYALSSAGVQAIWDALTSGLTTFGSIGKLLVTNIDAQISTRLSTTGAPGVIWNTLTSALTTVGSIGKLLVDNIDAAISSRLASAGYTAPLDAAGTRAAVGLASANLDTQLDALPTNAELATALDALPTANENADAYLDRADAIETGITPRQAHRLELAAAAGKLSGAATTTVAIRNVGDTKDRITATVDADGNRTAVTVDAT